MAEGDGDDLGPVRPLDPADLSDCLDLAAGRGWPREDVKWRFALDAGSVFGVDDPAGGLAAAIAVTRYEPGLAVIGLLVVAARHARRGLGRRLTEFALEWAGGRVVYLYATPEGQPLYEGMGFRVVDHVNRHAGRFGPPPGMAGGGAAPGGVTGGGVLVRPPVPADQAEVLGLDRAGFGASRATVLGALGRLAEQVVVAAADDGGVVGHGCAWRNLGVLAIGPVVARDDAAARAVIGAMAARAGGPVRVDVPAGHAGVSEWLDGRGVLRVGSDPLMSYGGKALPGERDLVYGLFMQAFG
ncbi:MAG TPA: GNAT family N-acetyltransferase [Streptosporangiaceae bacterium]|nr:GNAT family N-acetyltransferase [Streptosporangiaceae bacterium]